MANRYNTPEPSHQVKASHVSKNISHSNIPSLDFSQLVKPHALVATGANLKSIQKKIHHQFHHSTDIIINEKLQQVKDQFQSQQLNVNDYNINVKSKFIFADKNHHLRHKSRSQLQHLSIPHLKRQANSMPRSTGSTRTTTVAVQKKQQTQTNPKNMHNSHHSADIIATANVNNIDPFAIHLNFHDKLDVPKSPSKHTYTPEHSHNLDTLPAVGTLHRCGTSGTATFGTTIIHEEEPIQVFKSDLNQSPIQQHDYTDNYSAANKVKSLSSSSLPRARSPPVDNDDRNDAKRGRDEANLNAISKILIEENVASDVSNGTINVLVSPFEMNTKRMKSYSAPEVQAINIDLIVTPPEQEHTDVSVPQLQIPSAQASYLDQEDTIDIGYNSSASSASSRDDNVMSDEISKNHDHLGVDNNKSESITEMNTQTAENINEMGGIIVDNIKNGLKVFVTEPEQAEGQNIDSIIGAEKSDYNYNGKIYVFGLLAYLFLLYFYEAFTVIFTVAYCENSLQLNNCHTLGNRLISVNFVGRLCGTIFTSIIFECVSFQIVFCIGQAIIALAMILFVIIQLMFEHNENIDLHFVSVDEAAMIVLLHVFYIFLGVYRTIGISASFAIVEPVYRVTTLITVGDTLVTAIANAIAGYGVAEVLDSFGYQLIPYLGISSVIFQTTLAVIIVMFYRKIVKQTAAESDLISQISLNNQ